MSQSIPTSAGFSRQPTTWLLLLPLPVVAVLLATLSLQNPKPAILAALAIPLLLVTVTRPNVATLIVLFILYSNAATVAVHFHGVPFIIGASFSLLLLIPLAHFHFLQGQRLVVTPVLLIMFLFGLHQMIGAANALHPELAVKDIAVFLTEGMGLYFLIVNVIRTPKVLRQSMCVLLLAGAFMGGLSLYQYATGTQTNDYGGFAQIAGIQRVRWLEGQGIDAPTRIGGPVGGPNMYARILIMLLPLGVYFFARKKSRIGGWAAIATAICILGAAGLTKSRGAAVGLVMSLGIMAALGYIKLRRLVPIALAFVVLMLALPGYWQRISKMSRLTPVVTGQDLDRIREADSSTRSRLTEMAAAGLVALDHPIIGVGSGNFRLYYREYAAKVGLKAKRGTRQAHCLYLGVAAETGVIGLMIFLTIIYAVIRDIIRARKRCLNSHPDLANVLTAFLMMIVIYLTTGIVDDYAFIRYFWLVIALASAACRIADQVASNSDPVPSLAGSSA